MAIAAAALALPAPAPAQGGAATPVVGGGSFNTAPLLAPGTYSDTVAAGETVYWKVRIAKGQVLQVKATVDTSQIQTDALADDYDRGLAGLEYHLDIFSPLREQLSEESGGIYADASARLEGSADAGAKTGTATGPRVLGFEQILASDYDKAKFPAPGEWYVSLNAADSALAPANVPAELPIEVDVQVLGPGPGVLGGLRALAAGTPEAAAHVDDAGRGPVGAVRRHRPARRSGADPRARRRPRAPRRTRARRAGHRGARAPAHVAGRHGARPIFVVQKHAARTLHYDLRLEVDGRAQVLGRSQGPVDRPAREAPGGRRRGPRDWITPTSRAGSARAATAPARSSSGTRGPIATAPNATAGGADGSAAWPTGMSSSSSTAASCAGATP